MWDNVPSNTCAWPLQINMCTFLFLLDTTACMVIYLYFPVIHHTSRLCTLISVFILAHMTPGKFYQSVNIQVSELTDI